MNTNDLIYLISNEFDYEKIITIGEVGPTHASMMGWKYDHLSNIENYKGKVKLVDIRLTAAECEFVKSRAEHSEDLFVFCLIDPYQERTHPFFGIVTELKNRPNILVSLKYQPEEATADLLSLIGEKRVLTLNYPYMEARERAIHFEERKNKIVFSGRVGNAIYPERLVFLNRMRRSPLRLKIDFLTHPGYIDVGQKQKHDCIGDKYLDFLSGYTMMFTSSSRCRLEFLKFSECAYAGCVPVGTSPKTFHPEMKEFFLELNYERLTRSTLNALLRNRDELAEIAKNYRKAFRKWRNPDRLNTQLLTFLDQNLVFA